MGGGANWSKISSAYKAIHAHFYVNLIFCRFFLKQSTGKLWRDYALPLGSKSDLGGDCPISWVVGPLALFSRGPLLLTHYKQVLLWLVRARLPRFRPGS